MGRVRGVDRVPNSGSPVPPRVHSEGSVTKAVSIAFRGQIVKFTPNRKIQADADLRAYVEKHGIPVTWKDDGHGR